MNIAFAGTAEFALPAFQMLLKSPHKIRAVYTQPDRPAGRGQKLTASPIKKLAETNKLPIYQPVTLKDPIAKQQLQELNIEILVNVAYGLLIPETILTVPKFGCINIHPSLLPRWRGAAPIQRAILAGDPITGVTIMKMDIGFDTGDIYQQVTLPIDDTDTSATLMKKTAEIGAELLLEVLAAIENGSAAAIPQSSNGIIYASKITKEEGKINWHQSAQEISCMIRGFDPWPIAYTEIAGNYLRIWQAKIAASDKQPSAKNVEPGTIIEITRDNISVVTGSGILNLLKIQLSGGKPLPVADILHAKQQHFMVGQKLL